MTEHHDYETSFVIDDALSVIVLVQRLPSDSVAAKELQAAVTLKREARYRLARLVADARDEATSWLDRPHPRHRTSLRRLSLRAPRSTKEDATRTRLTYTGTGGPHLLYGVVGLADHRHIPEILDKITGITPSTGHTRIQLGVSTREPTTGRPRTRLFPSTSAIWPPRGL